MLTDNSLSSDFQVTIIDPRLGTHRKTMCNIVFFSEGCVCVTQHQSYCLHIPEGDSRKSCKQNQITCAATANHKSLFHKNISLV